MVWAILEPSDELTVAVTSEGGAGEENPGGAVPAAVLPSDKGFGQLIRIKLLCEGVRSWG